MKNPILIALCAILTSIVTSLQGQTTLFADTFPEMPPQPKIAVTNLDFGASPLNKQVN